MEYLKKSFPAIGASAVIRSRVSALVDELRASSQTTIDPELLNAADKDTSHG